MGFPAFPPITGKIWGNVNIELQYNFMGDSALGSARLWRAGFHIL